MLIQFIKRGEMKKATPGFLIQTAQACANTFYDLRLVVNFSFDSRIPDAYLLSKNILE